MNCSHCGKDLSLTQYAKLEEGTFSSDYFCDRACVRAWLYPTLAPREMSRHMLILMEGR